MGREFQIPFFGAGYALSAGTNHLVRRSGKLIEPTRLPGAEFQMEATYISQNLPTSKIELYDKDMVLVTSLTLPQTTSVVTRIRSSTWFSLTKDGVYYLKIYAAAGASETGMVRVLLNVRQPDHVRTVEHVQLSTLCYGHDDLSGIAGNEFMRGFSAPTHNFFPQMTTAEGTPTRYSENLVANSLPWFYYVPSEWNVSAIKLEMTCDGFCTTQDGALFKVDPTTTVQTQVPNSLCTHTNGDDPLIPVTATFSPDDMLGEGFYAFRGRTPQTQFANGFWYNACLHMILGDGPLITGNTYIILSGAADVDDRTVPTLTTTAGLECCAWIEPGSFFGNPQAEIKDAGTSDFAAGSILSGTIIDFHDPSLIEKTVKRSPTNIRSLLTVGNRIFGQRYGGSNKSSVLASLRQPFSYPLLCNFMLQADPENLASEKLPTWDKTFDFNIPEVGAIRDYEKSLYRLYVYYEDIGVATVKVTATSRRGQTYPPQTITIGTMGADGAPKVAIYDIAISDVLIKLHCEVTCGQVSIIMFSCEFEPKGRLAKNT